MKQLSGKLIPVTALFATVIFLMGFTPGSASPGKGKKKSQKTVAKKSTAFPPSAYRIVIDKSDFELQVYDADGWLATYPVVFGNKKQEDKKMEGDRLTPNGKFRITFKKYHKEWGCFMLIDYPTKESYKRFQERKTKGAIPKSATIGGGIGIHGSRPNEEYVVDKFINWTNGCISTKYSDIFELYDLIPLGTEVTIQE